MGRRREPARYGPGNIPWPTHPNTIDDGSVKMPVEDYIKMLQKACAEKGDECDRLRDLCRRQHQMLVRLDHNIRVSNFRDRQTRISMQEAKQIDALIEEGEKV